MATSGTLIWEITDWGGKVLGLHIAWWEEAQNLPWEVEYWRVSPWLPMVTNLVKDEGNAVYGEITGATRAERNEQANAMWATFMERHAIIPGTEALDWDGGLVKEIPGFDIDAQAAS
jgi:hypothetical protein